MSFTGSVTDSIVEHAPSEFLLKDGKSKDFYFLEAVGLYCLGKAQYTVTFHFRNKITQSKCLGNGSLDLSSHLGNLAGISEQVMITSTLKELYSLILPVSDPLANALYGKVS